MLRIVLGGTLLGRELILDAAEHFGRCWSYVRHAGWSVEVVVFIGVKRVQRYVVIQFFVRL